MEEQNVQKKNWLNSNILILGFVSLLTDISSEMIFSLLPIFLTTVLGANAAILGLIEGIADGTANILKLVSGWYSDKLGKRKPFVVFGYALSTLTKPFFALAGAWQQILFVRFLDRVGKGTRVSARDVIVANSSEEADMGKAFGFRKAMDAFGALLGPIFASILLSYFISQGVDLPSAYRTIFWIAVIPAVLAVILLFFLRVKEEDSPSNKLHSFRESLALLPAQFKLFLGIVFLFSVANFSYAFFILRTQDVGVSLALIPLLYALYNGVYTVSAFPIGMLADKLGTKRLIYASYFLFALICLGFAFLAQNFLALIILFALYGIFDAIRQTVQRAYIAETIPHEIMGTAMGVHSGAEGAGALLASILAGLFWSISAFGVPLTFLFSAFIALISALALVFLIDGAKTKAKIQT
ncbi:MAG: MFS transporter [Candidatus Micrarchaeota archaeon]